MTEEDITLEFLGNGRTSAPTASYSFRGLRHWTESLSAEEPDRYGTPEGDQDAFIISYITDVRFGTDLVNDAIKTVAGDYPLNQARAFNRFVKSNPEFLWRLRIRYIKGDDDTYLEYVGRLISATASGQQNEMVSKIAYDITLWEDTIEE